MTDTTALDVAALIIERQHAAGRVVTTDQLQSLLYLVQGAHYVMWGGPAFADPIIAGPGSDHPT